MGQQLLTWQIQAVSHSVVHTDTETKHHTRASKFQGKTYQANSPATKEHSPELQDTSCPKPRPWDSPGKNAGVGCPSFSGGSSPPRDWTWAYCTAGGFVGGGGHNGVLLIRRYTFQSHLRKGKPISKLLDESF